MILCDFATRLNELHQKHVDARQSALLYAKQCGEILLKVKAEVGHGSWKTWLKDNCGFSSRTAQRYMLVAKNWARIQVRIREKTTRESPISIREACSALGKAEAEKPKATRVSLSAGKQKPTQTQGAIVSSQPKNSTAKATRVSHLPNLPQKENGKMATAEKTSSEIYNDIAKLIKFCSEKEEVSKRQFWDQVKRLRGYSISDFLKSMLTDSGPLIAQYELQNDGDNFKLVAREDGFNRERFMKIKKGADVLWRQLRTQNNARFDFADCCIFVKEVRRLLPEFGEY